MRSLASRPDLIDSAYDALKEAIETGELEPGAPLAQEDLAARLGVSRQPVSHALKLLQREGLVVERGRKGLMVSPIDVTRLGQLYLVRGALDQLAARLAAERVRDQGAGAESAVRARLDAVLADGAAAQARDDVEKLTAADRGFHQALYAVSGNPEIGAMADGAWPQIHRSMIVVLADPAYRGRAWQEHRAIADAVLAGDPVSAAEASRAHAEEAGRLTRLRLTQAAEKGPTPDIRS
jgi:DNA-binding GntR family transcriptional regulator